MFSPKDAILITDDSATMRRLILDSLRELGFTNLVSSEDTNEGLKKLKDQVKKGDPVKLVLSDLNMPGKNGIDFLKLVKSSSQFKEVPFILVTTESEKTSVLEAAVSGVSGYLIKPFNVPDLSKKIMEIAKKIS